VSESAVPTSAFDEPDAVVATSPPTDRPWVIGEVAEYLRVEPRTVRRLVARGVLHVCRVSGTRRMLFLPGDVRDVVVEARK